MHEQQQQQQEQQEQQEQQQQQHLHLYLHRHRPTSSSSTLQRFEIVETHQQQQQMEKKGIFSSNSWTKPHRRLVPTFPLLLRSSSSKNKRKHQGKGKPVLPLLSFPNEIILIIAECLEAKEVYRLILTTRCLAHLLTPLLYKHAVLDVHHTNSLHWAAGKGHANLVKFLLQEGFDVNLQDPTRLLWTPLHYALKCRNRVPVVRLLLEGGADITLKDRMDTTALHFAVKARDKVAVGLLLEHSAAKCILDERQDREETALYLAAECDYYGDIWGPLLDMGADLSVRCRHGRTVIYAAVMNRNRNMAKMLLDRGADINDRDRRGRTPLHFVSLAANDFPMAKFLLDMGADADAQDYEGKTLLHYAVEYQDCGEIVRVLLQKGADPKVTNVLGLSPTMVLRKRIEALAPPTFRSLKSRLLSDNAAWVRQCKAMLELMENHTCTRA